MPQCSPYDEWRDSIYALLSLSDLACERAELSRYQSGGETPAKAIPRTLLMDVDGLGSRVWFTEIDLKSAGIDVDHLANFFFNFEERRGLLAQSIGHTFLERYPVARRKHEFFLVLPTAISLAIRRFVVEMMDRSGLRPAMLAALARDYSDLFRDVNLLGGPRGADLEFRMTENGYFAGVTSKVDRGRLLNLLFVMDNLAGFETDSFAGSNPDSMAVADDVDRFINHAECLAKADPDFQQGTTLIVGCGFGRGVSYALNNVDRADWRIEMISAPDLCTLSSTPDFKPLSLWRILDARDELERQGLQLHNINGLLNLVAWARTLKGHLVPHGELPDDFVESSASTFLMVNQNNLLELRELVARLWDAHMQRDLTGRWVKVRREGHSFFEEDKTKPLYASEEQRAGVFETSIRAWWCDVEVPENVRDSMGYPRWQTSTVWLARAAPVLEDVFHNLPAGALLWRTIYEGDLSNIGHDEVPLEYDEAVAELRVTIDRERRRILVHASRRYELAHLSSDNRAERALVAALVEGAAKLAGREFEALQREAVVDRIVRSPLARQQHVFTNPTLRDYVQGSLTERVTVIDQLDDAASKLGLGWKVRTRADGAWILGKSETTQFLNKLVSALQDDLATDLRQFERSSLLNMILRNHEAAAVDRAHWHRTTAAVVALHNDEAAARETISRYEFRLNAVFQSCRILAEFAICECPLTRGRYPGVLDLARLMTRAANLFNIGGWSDAIRWDVMEPRLRVTPLGDVHANWDFVNEVVEPFLLAAADLRLDDAIKEYPKNLEKRKVVASLADAFEPEFLSAFEEEFGVTIDHMRTFVEFVEDIAVRSKRAVVMLPRSSLLTVKTDIGELDEEIARRIVNALTLETRPLWKATPSGYDDRDRFPWRFRRRLTILRRPLLQIDHKENPTIIMSPAIVREAFAYSVSNFHRGSFPNYQLSLGMRKWAGRIADTRGRQFAEDVARRLNELGWKTEVDIQITKLLHQRFDRDFGDIDVLAWNPTYRRVLALECKDVQFRKTYGEVAEQLSDFRGELRANGKPDYLLLHLNRMELIFQHLPKVAAYLKWEVVDTIESHLVFRNPVPMSFALNRLRERVTVSLFDNLEKI